METSTWPIDDRVTHISSDSEFILRVHTTFTLANKNNENQTNHITSGMQSAVNNTRHCGPTVYFLNADYINRD